MLHVDAALTPCHRLKVARLVVDDGQPIAEVARFQCSWLTVKCWVNRYHDSESMQDQPSRPRTNPMMKHKQVVSESCPCGCANAWDRYSWRRRYEGWPCPPLIERCVNAGSIGCRTRT